MMLTSTLVQVPLGLLLTASLSNASPSLHKLALAKRDMNYNVIGGQNFPDPASITLDGVTYVFGTTTAGLNIPYTSSNNYEDASSWDQTLIDAFPTDNVPAFSSWAVADSSWAPDVSQLTDFDNSFAMYYSAALQSNNAVHCVGLARSGSVTGPYNDSSTAPMICPEDAGGAIDAAGFLDPTDNSRYVVYKIDGPAANNGGYCASTSYTSYNTSLMLLQTQNDGYTRVAGPVVLYDNNGVDDSYNIEAPVIRYSDGTYFLFFSSGCTSSNSYTVSYVTATNIWGPYGNRQLLLGTGDDGLFGPGGATPDATTSNFVYHSLIQSNDIGPGRQLNTANYQLSGSSVTVS